MELAVWSSQGIEVLLVLVATPWGIAVLFFAFLISCVSRVFLRSDLLKTLYTVFSFGPLLYLLLVGITYGSPANAQAGMLLAILFAFFAVPFSVGWLLGWLIAVLLQTAAQGSKSSTSGNPESN
jgi:hypothetical protein